MHIKYRRDIDGLRALAIISVLLFHLGVSGFQGGFVGVDVFFVISGFLITGIIKKEIDVTGRFSIKNFYLRRIRRIFPALFVTLFLTTLISILIFSPTHLSRIGAALTSAIFSVSNIFFWLEADYFDVSAKLKPLLHTWSLSVEEQFYLFWPLLLLFLMKLKKEWLPVLFLFGAGILSLYLNIIFADGSVAFIDTYFPKIASLIKEGQATIFFLLPFRIFEFAIGAMMVWFIHYQVRSWVYDLFFISGVILILYAVLTFNDKMLFPSYYGLVPTLGAGLVIYAGAHTRLSALLDNSLAVGIGLISYSLYLIHWPLIVFGNYLVGSLDSISIMIILTVSVLLAVISYHYIEQPFRTKKYDITKPKWKYGSMIATVMLAYLGINIHQHNGWMWRVTTPAVFEDAKNAKDYHKKFYGGAGYYGFYPQHSKKADIVLIGDSHGRQYAEGLYQLVIRESNLSMYVSECYSSLYLPHFIRTTNKNFIQGSKKALNKVLPFIQEGNAPIVILSETWLFQMKNADMTDSHGERLHKKISTDDIVNGLYHLKSLIGDSVLVVIGQVPGARYNLYDIFSRPRPFMDSELNLKHYIEVKPDPQRTAFNKVLEQAASVSGKFVFLDPHDVLCNNGLCRNLDKHGHLIYSDSNHLSKNGSIEVITGFLPVLKTLLQQRLTDEKN